MKSAASLFLFILLFLPPVYAVAQDSPEVRPFTSSGPGFQGLSSGGNADNPKMPSRAREPNVEIWLPPEFQSTENKWPLVVFSHEFGGCAAQATFLAKHIADHGYIVIAPDHEDAHCAKSGRGRLSSGDLRGGKAQRPEKPFRHANMWTDKTEADRKDDILFAVSSMLDDRMYKNYVDTDRMALMGHGLGGYNVLGLAGAWKEWKDSRFKAIIGFSPYIAPFHAARSLGRTDVPVLYVAGPREMTTAAKDAANPARMAYAASYAPKHYIEIPRWTQFGWTDIPQPLQLRVAEVCVAFLDRYLKDAEGPVVEDKDSRILLYQSLEKNPEKPKK